jgi:hypothetical protein
MLSEEEGTKISEGEGTKLSKEIGGIKLSERERTK